MARCWERNPAMKDNIILMEEIYGSLCKCDYLEKIIMICKEQDYPQGRQ